MTDQMIYFEHGVALEPYSNDRRITTLSGCFMHLEDARPQEPL